MGGSESSQSISQTTNDSKEIQNILKLWSLPTSYFKDKMAVTKDKMRMMLDYLMKKHSDSCYYHVTSKLFEIEWYIEIGKEKSHELLYFEQTLKDLLANKSDVCKDKRFILIPFFLHLEDMSKEAGEAHQNILIFDRKQQTIERFEPHGHA
jgi:hypothetical protein